MTMRIKPDYTKRTSQEQGRHYIRWIKAYLEALQNGQQFSLLPQEQR